MGMHVEYEGYTEKETDDITARKEINKINALGDAITAGLLGEELTLEQEEALDWMDEVQEERDKRRKAERRQKFHVVNDKS